MKQEPSLNKQASEQAPTPNSSLQSTCVSFAGLSPELQRYASLVPCSRRSHLAIVVSLLALAACTERFEVLVVNQRNVPVEIGVGQFHAPDFTANPPASFTEKELIGQQIVRLQPNEQRKLVYNSAAGGFWLQWRMLDPLPEPNPLVRLDLIREERRIVIR